MIIKIYAYVDETGQDTRGELFIVAVVVIIGGRDESRKDLQAIEIQSGRGKRKWTRSTDAERLKYLQLLFDNKKFRNSLFYSMYKKSDSFADLTIRTTASAIKERITRSDYKAVVIIDGLRKSQYPRYAAGLRSFGVKTRKVRGIRDEADEFVRLADSMAGFVRDYLSGVGWTKDFYKKASAKGFLKEVK